MSRPGSESIKIGTGDTTPSKDALRLLPSHVAIIMDGNGRWASKRGKDRSEGHQAGTGNIHRIVDVFSGHGVRYLTLFAFSTENWYRPKAEVRRLIEILHGVIGIQIQTLHEKDVRVRHLGRLDRLSVNLQNTIKAGIELTKHNTGMTLSVAFDYGGRAEILDAIQRIVIDQLPAKSITEEVFQDYLQTADVPDPDLIIRTGGEMRLSNFLLWQSAYSEYYSTPVLWPDFGEKEVDEALDVYSQRQRRFGKVDHENVTT